MSQPLATLVDDLQRTAVTLDQEGAVPTAAMQAVARAGLLAAPVPHTLGGLGLGTEPGQSANLLHLLAEIGRGNLSIGRIYEGHVNTLQLIKTLGTPDQLEAAAVDARDAQRLFGVWNTEAADGVHLHAIASGRYRMSGSKTFASGAGVVARAMVTGRLPDGGWQMCLVPMDQVETKTDSSWWRPIGMYGSASFKVDFTGVEIGPDALIGGSGDYQRQPWFSGGAVRFAAVQLGGAAALFDAARAELRALGRTGDPHQQARFGQMAIDIEAGRHWLQAAAPIIDLAFPALDGSPADDRTSERIIAYANMTRSAIERICLEIIPLVERSVGARGLLKPHPIERIVRDLTMYLRQPVPDLALTDVGRYALAMDTASPVMWEA